VVGAVERTGGDTELSTKTAANDSVIGVVN